MRNERLVLAACLCTAGCLATFEGPGGTYACRTDGDCIPGYRCSADNQCMTPGCGDGLRDAGEVCDDGVANSDAWEILPHCNADCSGIAPYCGDGVVAAEEACDGGEPAGSTGEADGGGGDAGSAPRCADDCTLALPDCGNGRVDAGEECDGGGESDTCNADCTVSACGDGVANAAAGEECDPAMGGPCGLDCRWLCPGGMVRLGTTATCIDAFEAVAARTRLGDLFDGRDLELRGQTADDYPSGHPDNVASAECRGSCLGHEVVDGSTGIYANSVANVLPSRYVTWYQAKSACEASGKRLCSGSEWEAACSSFGATSYPYGNDPAEVCDGVPGVEAPHPTGTLPGCSGGLARLFDMSGNVGEWTSDCDGGLCRVGGGSYQQPSACADVARREPLAASADVGYRCCISLEPE